MAKNEAETGHGDLETAAVSGGAVAVVDAERKKPVKIQAGAAKTPAKPSKTKPVKAAGKKGLFQRLRQYLKEVAGELKKVHWPARQELLTYTGVVLASVGILAVLTWVVDSGLSYVLIELLGR
jgi:preprotein translocase subunit SecE